MPTESELNLAAVAREFLAAVLSLRDATSAAIDSIARDDLRSLTAQIERQQLLCAQLESLHHHRTALRGSSEWPRIHSALLSLGSRLHVYASLVSRANRSNRILLALAQSRRTTAPGADAAQPATLSCEV